MGYFSIQNEKSMKDWNIIIKGFAAILVIVAFAFAVVGGGVVCWTSGYPLYSMAVWVACGFAFKPMYNFLKSLEE